MTTITKTNQTAVPELPSNGAVEDVETDMEEALDMAGVGWYQVFHCALMWALLASALLEMIGYAFILPAATCDLDVPDNLKGLLASIPNIGIILTAPLWGRASDYFGRKPVLFISSAAAGIFGLAAAFTPNLLAFGLCKLFGALFLSSSSSLSYAYAGEMTPRRRRDFVVLVCNGLLTVGSVLSPVFAWAVLSSDWRFHLGDIIIRPWRLLTAVYALPLILTAIWMTQAKESPKFLLAKGKNQEALEVLRHIYSKNSGLHYNNFKVRSLKSEDKEAEPQESSPAAAMSSSGLALLRPPHLKWFALLAFLMFGLFALLNGLFLFATDTLNKVLRESPEERGTLCGLINQPDNKTSPDCNDTISQDTFTIMAASTSVYAVLVLLFSIIPLSKKLLVLGMFLVSGAACLIAGLVTNSVVAGFAMSAFQLSAVGIGPITAYAVELFPTTLRGTAVGVILMFGRVGSVSGANVAGYLLAVACAPTFYAFAAFIFSCAALSLLLPKDKPAGTTNENVQEHR